MVDILRKMLVELRLVTAVRSVLGKEITSSRRSVRKHADSISMYKEDVKLRIMRKT
jgi:hypothetical protein